MKIAILTFSKELNYGANLQCYALSRILEKMNHTVEIIDIQLSPIPSSLITTCFNYFTEKLFSKFRQDYFPPFTKHYSSPDELKADSPEADLYIVGSDQVWNPNITQRLDPKIYFFNFLPNEAKRIAYAASFGVNEWKITGEENLYQNLLSKFSFIGVREESGIDICNNIFNLSAAKVLDPTLLLESYEDIMGKCVNTKNELIYFKFNRDSECESLCLELAKINGLRAVYLANNRPKAGFKYRPFISVQQWLKSINQSKLVITDSFHCMVFCILLHKKFIVFPSFKGLEGRMLTLLKDLSLEACYCSNIKEFKEKKDYLLQMSIDYTSVENKLCMLRRKSLNYLKEAIGEVN